MRSRTLNDHRNELIYVMYCELWASGLRENLIWPKIKEKFHLEETTIYRIVLKQVKTAKNLDTQVIDHIPQSPNASN